MVAHTLKVYLAFAKILFLATVSVAQESIQNDRSQSSITYVLAHRIHTVHGVSNQVSSVVSLDRGTQEISAVKVTAPVKSFDSGNKTRDKDMLKVTEAAKYPEVVFQSSSISTHANQLNVQGQLTFHGVTKPVSFKAAQQQKGKDIVVAGELVINLEDYNIKHPSVFGMKVQNALPVRFYMVYPTNSADP